MNDAETKRSGAELAAVYRALERVQAIIEFDLDGTVIAANDNFLELFGYEAEEIVGCLLYTSDAADDFAVV